MVDGLLIFVRRPTVVNGLRYTASTRAPLSTSLFMHNLYRGHAAAAAAAASAAQASDACRAYSKIYDGCIAACQLTLDAEYFTPAFPRATDRRAMTGTMLLCATIQVNLLLKFSVHII